MPRIDSNADSKTAPTTDSDVAGTYNEVVTTQTDTGEFSDLPDHLRTHLNKWLDHYMRRRRAERGVSPIASQLIEIFQPDVCNWTHRADPEQLGPRKDSFATPSTRTTIVESPSFETQNSVTSSMQQHGWKVTDIWAGDDDSAVVIGYSTTVYDYELLRRLLLAGLTQLEALAFWATDVVDLRRGGGLVNDYLETAKKRDDAAHHLAEALDISADELSAAHDRGSQTVRTIDPNLPEFLADGRGGQPLPGELWSDTELQELRSRRSIEAMREAGESKT